MAWQIGKWLSIFLGVFVKVTYFAQVINFREKAHGKNEK